VWYTFEGRKIKCDPRCVSATGTHCDCPCGGTFHGSAWGKAAQPEEWKDNVRAKMISDLKALAESLNKGRE